MSQTDEILLFQPGRAFGVPNPSPFCIKLETWLRMAELPYRVKLCVDPRKGPNGKIPFVEIDGRRLGDSELIIAELSGRFGIDLDKGLDATDRAAAHAFQRMIEEHLYWIAVYGRWMEDGPFEVLKRAFFGKLPPVMRQIAPVIIRRSVRKTFHAQGLGRHERAVVYAKANADLTAISGWLGKKPYLMGDAPRTVDAAAYGVLASIIDAELDTPVRPIGRAFENLTAYTARIRERYFADLETQKAAA